MGGKPENKHYASPEHQLDYLKTLIEEAIKSTNTRMLVSFASADRCGTDALAYNGFYQSRRCPSLRFTSADWRLDSLAVVAAEINQTRSSCQVTLSRSPSGTCRQSTHGASRLQSLFQEISLFTFSINRETVTICQNYVHVWC
jgi:hypothetical protein